MKRSLERVSLGLFIFLATGGLAPAQVAINVGPALPSDITGGAPAATLQQAAAFAWQEFIALNWPAMAGQRDVADPNQKFGPGSGPLVWQMFRGKVEIFNLTKDGAPPGYSATAPGLGYKLRGLIFTEPNQCQLVLDRSCPPRQPKDDPGFAGLPFGGKICVNQRYEPIPPDVIAVNLAAHVAITVTIRRTGSGIRHGSISNWFQSRPRRSMSPQSRQPSPSTVRARSSRPTLSSRQIIRCSDSRAPSPVRARRPRLV